MEEIGLHVTKNLAENDFLYSLHHCYGTVTFPVVIQNRVRDKPYLIDTTYRQFFSSIRCHKGMYYRKEDDMQYPDPGYFVEDLLFAKTLLKDGYIELTQETAKKYGRAFTLSGNYSNQVDVIDYLSAITKSRLDYYLSRSEMEGLEVCFPECKVSRKYR